MSWELPTKTEAQKARYGAWGGGAILREGRMIRRIAWRVSTMGDPACPTNAFISPATGRTSSTVRFMRAGLRRRRARMRTDLSREEAIAEWNRRAQEPLR